MSLTIGVDIGGTKVLGGVADPAGKVIATSRRATPAGDVAATRDVIVDVIRELAAGHPVRAVGIGAAGWIDESRSTVRFAPNLAWRDEPLRDYVAAACGLPVVVENDANAAAWGEFQYGAAADAASSMVMFTVGTGIGSGIVLGGQLWRGAHGMAAESGHMLAVPDGQLCGCGRLGCLEQYASGNALVRFAQQRAAAEPQLGEIMLTKAGGEIDAIDGHIVTAAAQAGDEAAIGAFQEIGFWLGHGLADLTNVLDPQVLVIGGGVVEAGDLLLAPARQALEHALAERAHQPRAELRAAALGNEAGLVGAADLARH